MEILGLAHKYGFSELEVGISDYLKVKLIRKIMMLSSLNSLFDLRLL